MIEQFASTPEGMEYIESNGGALAASPNGASWTKETFEVIESRFTENKMRFLDAAKENSQWRSVCQTCFVVLASLSVLLLWLKLNHVAQKCML